MNSLNAFKRIMEKYGKTNTLEGTYDDFLTIKKDLEVLEILREHFSCTEYGYWYIDISESDFDYEGECTKEEWDKSPQKKIKEWLKNDKT